MEKYSNSNNVLIETIIQGIGERIDYEDESISKTGRRI